MQKHLSKYKAQYGGAAIAGFLATAAVFGITPADLVAIPATNDMVVQHHDRIKEIEKDVEFEKGRTLEITDAIFELKRSVDSMKDVLIKIHTLQEIVIEDVKELQK